MAFIRKYWVWILIALVVLIIVWMLWRNWDKIKSRLGKVSGDFQPGGITDKREGDLENLAQDTYDAIYGMGEIGTTTNVILKLREVNALNDTELDYLARFYEKSITRGNSLYKDIDDEFMPFTSIDETLMGRLNQLGLR